MKILHLITTLEPGGAENQLLILARSQVRSGQCVKVAYLKGTGGLASKFEDIGCEVISCRSKLRLLFLIRKSIKLFDPDVIHTHLPRAEIVAYLLCRNRPIVNSRHNAEAFWPSGNSFLSRFLSRVVTSRSVSVIAISKGVSNFLITNREVRDSSKISVVYYGFDDMVTCEMPRKFPKSNHFRFLCVSRLVEQKDIPTLLEAFALQNADLPGATLTIVGDGNLKSVLRSRAEELGISRSVSWLGKLTEVRSIYKSHDCLVLPSRYEGFGLVLLEAMQAGLPIIASSYPVIIEVLSSDHPGIFEIGKSSQLASLMLGIRSETSFVNNSNYSVSRLNLFNPQKQYESIHKIYAKSVHT